MKPGNTHFCLMFILNSFITGQSGFPVALVFPLHCKLCAGVSLPTVFRYCILWWWTITWGNNRISNFWDFSSWITYNHMPASASLLIKTNHQRHLLFVLVSCFLQPRSRFCDPSAHGQQTYTTTKRLTLLIKSYSQLLLLNDSGLEHIDLEVRSHLF